MRFLLRRRLSRTDRCQSDGKSKKRATWMGDEPPLLARLSARCRLSFVFIWSGFYCSYSFASSSSSFSSSFSRLSLALFRPTAKACRAYERTGSQITIDPCAWRLRETSPSFEGDSFSHSRTRGTRINVCSRHRKYLSDMRYIVSNPLEGRRRILTLRRPPCM